MAEPLRLGHLTTIDMSLSLLLAKELEVDVDAGFDVYGLSAPGPYVPDVEALGVTHVPIPALSRSWDLSSDLTATRQLVSVLRDLRLDILHTHNPKSGVLGRVLGRAVGIPVVVNTCHGLWVRPEDSLPKRAAVLGIEALAAQFSSAELYQNDLDRRALSRWVPASKATTVGNGIDLVRFQPDEAGRARVRRELGVADDELLVGGVGRLVREKGVEEFADAARSLHGVGRFVWVGPDDDAKPDQIEDRSRDVTFLGERRDMPAVYSAFDVFVLPSHREGFSRSAMEAAACGRALVLSDIRGCREIGEPEVHAVFAPPRDADVLVRQIRRLLDDATLRARIGEAARKRAVAHFDQAAIARRSLEAYRRTARRKRLPWAEQAEAWVD